MASGYVQVPPDSTGKKVDCTSISSGAVRQVIVVGDPTVSSGFATVTGGKLNVNASVGALPNVNISAMPNVVIAAGTNNIGTINAISATVNVAGSFSISGTIDKISAPVALAAGSANIGSINNISATVNVVVTNRVSIDSVSGVVTVVGQTPPGSSGTAAWPVMEGGIDGSGNIRTFRTNTNGELLVNVSAMPAVNISSLPAVSLAAGATLDGISKNVNVVVTNAINISSMPAISVGPISTIDKISQTVLVAITSAINLNISSMPSITVSVGPITTIDKISATVLVAGSVALAGAIAGKVNVVTAPNDYVFISGPVAPGTAGTGYYPVHMGGLDGSGIARTMKMDSSGNVQVGVPGTVTVVGVVALGAGAANIGTINNISATVNVAGTFTIGTIDKISATVVMAGVVSLAAGSANIGTIDGISKTVAVSVAATLGVTGTVALAAGSANIGTIDGISKTVNVSVTNAVPISGSVVLAAGSNNIGTINGISATVTVQQYPRAVASASHGPKTVTLSTSAGVALVAAPGAALSVYVTQLLVTNGSASLTRVDIYEASATATPAVAQYAAASGGGFTITFDPPYKVSANTALNARIKPNASQVLVTPNFYVGS